MRLKEGLQKKEKIGGGLPIGVVVLVGLVSWGSPIKGRPPFPFISL